MDWRSGLNGLFNAFVMRMIQSLSIPWGPREGANGIVAPFSSLGNGAVASIEVQAFQTHVIDCDQDFLYVYTSGQTPADPVTRLDAGAQGWRSLRKGVYRRVTPPGMTRVNFIGITASGYADVQRLPSEVGEKGEW